MSKLTYPEIFEYINTEIIKPFYEYRVAKISEVQLIKVLKRKNPYLFKAKNITTAQDLVTEILQAHISSQEETVFGNYLEELAILICSRAYGGIKSSAEGIDLEFEKNGKKYIVAIKSGPNWANSNQTAKMKLDFQRAKKVLRQSGSMPEIVAVNGCCYGKDNRPDKGDYFKYCGQLFWELISGDEELYIRIIEPLDKQAKEKDESFKEAYSKKVNLLTAEFLNQFCIGGQIDWQRLIKFVSSKNLI
jgi:hypothetical protein